MQGLVLNKLLKLQEENAKMSGGKGPDYDYSKLGEPDSRGHGSDKGKLPNHPSFSKQSDYASKKYPGGEWGKDFQGKDVFSDRQTFTPSDRMVKEHGKDQLENYFKFYEPDVRLIFNRDGSKKKK